MMLLLTIAFMCCCNCIHLSILPASQPANQPLPPSAKPQQQQSKPPPPHRTPSSAHRRCIQWAMRSPPSWSGSASSSRASKQGSSAAARYLQGGGEPSEAGHGAVGGGGDGSAQLQAGVMPPLCPPPVQPARIRRVPCSQLLLSLPVNLLPATLRFVAMAKQVCIWRGEAEVVGGGPQSPEGPDTYLRSGCTRAAHPRPPQASPLALHHAPPPSGPLRWPKGGLRHSLPSRRESGAAAAARPLPPTTGRGSGTPRDRYNPAGRAQI